jgi:hypothetical protein
MIKWDEEIETVQRTPAKVISRDYKIHGEDFCLVQIDHVPGNSGAYTYDQNGIPRYGSIAPKIHNKPKIVTKWIILWKAWPGSVYYKTEDEAKEGLRQMEYRDDFLKIIKVEWEHG